MHNFVLFGQLQIASIQAGISNEQKEIFAQTSQSNLADLLLISSQGNPEYAFSSLTGGNKEMLAVGVVNLGKSVAPYVSIQMNSKEFVGFNLDKNNEEKSFFAVENLESTKYNATFFNLRINPPFDKNFKMGERNVTFEVTCPFCEVPSLIKNITICVYSSHQNYSKECGKIERV